MPVRVIYPPESERVTHFHSVRDPARIVYRVLFTLATAAQATAMSWLGRHWGKLTLAALLAGVPCAHFAINARARREPSANRRTSR